MNLFVVIQAMIQRREFCIRALVGAIIYDAVGVCLGLAMC
jgi:hypothetical protein